ncbi:hypothetical protein ACOYW6_02875 [Parablastomonas sp. CN1-191]|uniref:hypothetical protein n=1 Tax=Parablastomonas sp. CN1-191 TaxID=3400908 RepID=UPI003BF91707
MSKTPTKAKTTRATPKAKVAAAKKRQASRRASVPDRDPPENYRSLAAEYPWLVVGAGVLGGALIASFFPKKMARKLGKSAIAAAAAGTEIASVFAKQTREAAHDGLGALEDIGGTVGENATAFAGKAGKLGGEVAEKAGEIAGDAAERARAGGLALAREAIKLAGRIRR